MASVPGKYLNMESIIKKVFDETTDSLRMSSSGTSTIVIDAADDSIAIGDRVSGNLASVSANGGLNTNIVGVTPVSGRVPVDIGGATVNITGPVTVTNEVEIKNDAGNPIPVDGTVSVTGVSTLAEQQTQTTILNSIDNKLTSPISVSATNLDIRDLVFATDKVDVTGSSVTVSNTVAISAVSLPLPNGASTLAEQQLQTTELVNVNTQLNDVVTNTASIVTSTSDILVESQTQTGLQTDILNKLNTSIAVTATDLDIRNLVFSTDKADVSGSVVGLDSTTLTALENINVTVTNDNVDTDLISGAIVVTSTAIAANVSGTNLVNRKFISITPRASGVFMGDSGVTTTTGTPLFLNQTITLDISDNVDVYLIVASGSANVRIIEGA